MRVFCGLGNLYRVCVFGLTFESVRRYIDGWEEKGAGMYVREKKRKLRSVDIILEMERMGKVMKGFFLSCGKSELEKRNVSYLKYIKETGSGEKTFLLWVM